MRTWFRGAVSVAVLCAGGAPLAGCGSNSAKPVSPATRLKAELKRPYVAMRAEDIPLGDEFDRVPIDLWGPFRWEITFGAFDAERVAGLENTFFGTEVDSRGTVTESYYGIYANLQAGGLYVYVEYEENDGGYNALPGITYPGVRSVEAAIEHDGTNLRFFARPQGSAAAFDDLGTVALSPQPFPLNPGFGAFAIAGSGEVGFDDMRIASNSPAPTPVGPEHAAFNAIFDAVGSLAEAKYALTGPAPDTAAAANHLAAAGPKMEAADAAVAALTGSSVKAGKKSKKALKKAKKRLAKMRAALTKSGASAAPKVLNDLATSFFTMTQAADAIVPQELRDSLPGEHHSLK